MSDLLKEHNRDGYSVKIIDLIPAVLFEFSISRQDEIKLIHISSRCRDILGCDSEFIIKNIEKFWNLINQRDIKKILRLKKNIKSNNVYFIEIKIDLPDRGERWIQISSLPSKKNTVEILCGKDF